MKIIVLLITVGTIFWLLSSLFKNDKSSTPSNGGGGSTGTGEDVEGEKPKDQNQ